MSAVATADLTKQFGSQYAVDGVDLDVPAGAVYGFLGPNGSGKTTTIRMLLGLITPTRGNVELLGGRDLARALPHVGALVEGPGFHLHLSGRANLHRLDAADLTSSRATRRQRVEAALERVGLSAAADKRYRAYSLGMRQRLGIAASLLRPRQLLILDEPTNGLDPQGTREVRHLVGSLAAEGVTVLISSHLLSEVEQMCSHVGVMRAGRLVAQGSVFEVVGSLHRSVRLETDRPERAVAVLRRLGLGEVRLERDVAVATLGDVDPASIVAEAVAGGLAVTGFQVVRPTLEEAFVALTGEGFDIGE